MDDTIGIWCGPDRPPRRGRSGRNISLSTFTPLRNVHLSVENISRKLVRNPPPVLLDLLEIASYVYSADQAFVRGGVTLQRDGKNWRRSFRFQIPVRCLDIWKAPAVKVTLEEILNFVSDDFFEFEFRSLTRQQPLKEYFDFDQGKPWFEATEVMLFSGGLDSLAGLCESIFDRTGKIILVSHRPAPQTDAVQRHLVEDFTRITGSSRRILHIPVWVNKSEYLTRDTHQRTRSFLYASLAIALAQMHDLDRIYFYENGITSANLAISPAVIGSRASRTTHPSTLVGYARLFSELFERAIQVDNPFFWKTKADIVKLIKDKGLQRLIRNAVSCSHVRSADPIYSHCGVCSQCVGRRLAIFYNALESDDPGEMYKINLPLGAISKPDDRSMVESIVKTGRELDRLNIMEFYSGYPQAMEVVSSLGGDRNKAAIRVHELHKRHGRQMCEVLQRLIVSNAQVVARGEVQPDSLLSMIVSQEPDHKVAGAQKLAMSLPENIGWENIEIEVVSDEALRIRAGAFLRTMTYFELGFADKRKGDRPNLLWTLLIELAKGHGELTWKSYGAKSKLYKSVQRLRAAMRVIFGMGGDPIESYQKNQAYVTRFRIADCRFGKR